MWDNEPPGLVRAWLSWLHHAALLGKKMFNCDHSIHLEVQPHRPPDQTKPQEAGVVRESPYEGYEGM